MVRYVLNENASLLQYKPYAQTLQWMAPTRFLEMAGQAFPMDDLSLEGWYSKGSYETVHYRIANELTMDPLFLDFDITDNDLIGLITGHEGRHRALVSRDLKVKQVPVIIFHRDEGEEHTIEGYRFVREVPPYVANDYYGTPDLPACCSDGHRHFIPQGMERGPNGEAVLA